MEGHAQRTESIKMLQALIETLDLSRLILMIIHTRKLLTSKTYCTERKIFSMTLQYAKTLKAPNKKWEKQTYWVNGVFFWSLILATPPPFSPLSFQATVPGTKMCEVLKNEETYSSVKVSILGFVDFCGFCWCLMFGPSAPPKNLMLWWCYYIYIYRKEREREGRCFW